MKLFSTLLLALALTGSSTLFADSNCPCEDCKCTQESHCGCKEDKGCGCSRKAPVKKNKRYTKRRY